MEDVAMKDFPAYRFPKKRQLFLGLIYVFEPYVFIAVEPMLIIFKMEDWR